MAHSFVLNTENFYRELKGECNPDKLLEFSKQGIFLDEPLMKYEKIKDHEYLVDISILGKQFYMINNDTQYNRLKFWYYYLFDNTEDNKEFIHLDLYNDTKFFDMIIINKFLIEKLLEEDDDEFLLWYISATGYNVFLSYLYSYSYIKTKEFILFYKNYYTQRLIPDLRFEIFNYFYFNNNKHLFDNFMKINGDEKSKIEKIIDYLIKHYSNDVNILNYCLDMSNKYNLTNGHYQYFSKLPLNHSLKYLKYFSEKLFKENSLYFKCNDNNTMDFINLVFSDNGIKSLDGVKLEDNHQIMKYGIDLNRISNYEIIDKKDIDIENEDEIIEPPPFKYNTFKELIKLRDPEYAETDFYRIYCSILDEGISIYEIPFVNTYLNNYKKINKILKDPYYVLNIDINTKSPCELFLKRICYVVSLIHNNYSKFLIYNYFHIYHLFYELKTENNKLYIESTDFTNHKNIRILSKILKNTPHKKFNNYFE